MRGSALEDYLQRELHCQVRRKVSSEIRKRVPEGSEPMVSGITVMLGSVLTMAAGPAGRSEATGNAQLCLSLALFRHLPIIPASMQEEQPINLEPLAKALEQLQTSLRYARSDLAASDKDLAKQFRAAAIQAFEYTFEISIRMLRRRLETILPGPEVERLPYRDMLRVAAEKNFIDNPAAWFRFRAMRNNTSHSYDEIKAEQLAAMLPEFADQAAKLLNQLRR